MEEVFQVKPVNAAIKFVTTHYMLTLCIIVLITGVMGRYYIQIRQENSIESFFFEDDPILLQYNEFRKKVASDELVVIGFMEKNLYSNEHIDIIRKISAALKNIQGIKRVHSITEIDEVVIADDEISLRKLIPDGRLSQEQLNQVKQKISALKGYNRLTSATKNGTAAIIIAELEPYNNKERLRLADDIIHTTEKISNNRVKLYHSGIPIIFAEMDKLTKKDMFTMFPLVGLIIFTMTILLFRNFTLTMFAMLTLVFTLVWTVGLFVMLGEKATFITSILPAVLFALAIADSVHLISHFLDEAGTGLDDYTHTVAVSTREVWLPCLLTTLTTAVGFFSFVTSPLRPVYILGIFAAAGVILAFIIDMTFLPAALVLLRKRITNQVTETGNVQTGKERNRVLTKLVHKIGRFSTTHVAALMVIFTIIIISAVAGMSKLRFESNPLKHLSDGNEIKSDLMFLEHNFGGFIPHMVIIKSTGKNDFTQPEMVKLVDEFEQEILKKYPEYISDSFSIADYVKELNRIFNNNDEDYYTIPGNRADIVDYYEMGIYPDFMKRLISRDRREIYITFMGLAGSGSVEEWQSVKTHQMSAALDFVSREFGDTLHITETGLTELLIQMEVNLKTSQIRSIFLSFFLIFIMMLIMCKNLKLAIIGMIPNIFPIITTLGVMGWLNIPLNETTIMISAVTLGIAVDDTVHFLTWYIRNTQPGVTIRQALLKAFKTVGKPIIITTILLSASFSVLLLGSFKPVQTYGILTAFSLLMALIADLFLLPVLILIFKPKSVPNMNAETEETFSYQASSRKKIGYAEAATTKDKTI